MKKIELRNSHQVPKVIGIDMIDGNANSIVHQTLEHQNVARDQTSDNTNGISMAISKQATSPDFNGGSKKRNAVTPYSLEDLQENDNMHDNETRNASRTAEPNQWSKIPPPTLGHVQSRISQDN